MAIDISPLGAVGNLPGPAKAGLAVAGGGGILGGVYAMTGGNVQVVAIIAAGMVIIALMLAGYKVMLGWLRKRRAAPLERAILDNSAAAPNSISQPASRARLDDLRRSFENGVQKFKDSGKNIYSLPWYMLVGEPGSGKTEAVRHCNVGFPPGLQDELQGAGGTINMNWWFTNHAIIVDTAGRLMFEEVAPGGTSEWKEFLVLLSRVRPNCPINGMLLTIPADSLIRDTADSISKKAGKIAQQLDSIQRTLGVRFPVFIVVTKCDLINGFREFFDGLNDPQLQHQIMGWSNPNPLDMPFSPDQVEQHLKTVSGQLARRRQGLLLDPVNTEDPDGRRIDQVDALYSFPESLLGIAPRLRRYLEMVFVAGEWSPKPLFLRGIYFTSSMREGAALDKELADVLGVPLESLPEGKVWERDRAYFLRDLFIQKVFKEKGLVTRASNTQQLQRKRKVAVIATGILAVFVLLGLTWFGKSTLDRSIGTQRDFWTSAKAEYTDPSNFERWALVARRKDGVVYDGDKPLSLGRKKTTRADFHADTVKAVKDPIEIPWVFKPLAMVTGNNPNILREKAYRTIYEASVLNPLLRTVRDKLKDEKDWSERPNGPSAALAQLIRLETYNAKAKPAAKADDTPLELDPLFKYALAGEPKYDKDRKALQDAFEYLYPKDKSSNWMPPEMLVEKSGSAVNTAVTNFSNYWRTQAKERRSPRLMAITQLRDALVNFKGSEQAIANAAKVTPGTMAEYDNAIEISWKPEVAKLAAAKKDADDQIATLEAKPSSIEIDHLTDLLKEEITRIQNEARAAHQKLIEQLPPPQTSSSTELADVRRALTDGLASVDGMSADTKALTENFTDVETYYLSKEKKFGDKRRYAIHFDAVYQKVGERLTAPAPAGDSLSLSNTGEELGKITKADEALLGDIRALPSGFGTNPDRVKQAATSAEAFVLNHGSYLRHNVIKAVLANAPSSADQVAQKIGAMVAATKGDFPRRSHPIIPFTLYSQPGDFDDSYNGPAASAYLSGWSAISALLSAKSEIKVLEPQSLATTYQKLQPNFTDYADKYLGYWRSKVPNEWLAVNVENWSDVFLPKNRIVVFQIMDDLQGIAKAAREALTMLRPSVTAEQQKPFDDAIKFFPEAPGAALRDTAQSVVLQWNAVPAEADAARRAVLAKTPSEFMNKYLIEAPADNLYVKYWSDLPMGYLRALAKKSQENANNAIKTVRAFCRFPLCRPVKGTVPLTPAEVQTARDLLDQIVYVTAGNGGIQTAIGEGGRAGVDRLDQEFAKLRGVELSKTEQTLFKGMREVADCLPNAAKPMAECTISTLEKQAFSDRLSETSKEGAYSQWKRIAVCRIEKDAAGKEVAVPLNGDEVLTLDDKAVELGKIHYPASATTTPKARFDLRLKPNPANNWTSDAWSHPIQTGEADDGGDWGPLELIFTDNAKRIPLDNKKFAWHCQFIIDGKAVWIKVEFDKPFPDRNDWPAAPAKN
jgi:hypothetical protein